MDPSDHKDIYECQLLLTWDSSYRRIRHLSFRKVNKLTRLVKVVVEIGAPGLPNSQLHHLRELIKHSPCGTPAKNL